MSASAPSFDWNAGSPAHDSHGDGSFVCSFLSSLSNVSDDDLFSSLYAVLIGYALLIFAPSWPKTKSITLFLSGVYSLMYLALLVRCVVAHPELSETGVDFGSLQGVVKLFKDESVVFAGWTHYIAFDLFVARYITMDAQIHGTCQTVSVGGAYSLLMEFLRLTRPCDYHSFCALRLCILHQSAPPPPISPPIHLRIQYDCVLHTTTFACPVS